MELENTLDQERGTYEAPKTYTGLASEQEDPTGIDVIGSDFE